MKSTCRIVVGEESQVGSARRAAMELCQGIGGGEEFCGKAAIIVTEMAKNLVRHGDGGEMLFRELPDERQPGFEIMALDRGRGMRNSAECMRDGFSTIGTAGQGLGAIQRLSDDFEVYSQPRQGTVAWSRLCSKTTPPGGFLFGGVSVATEREDVCGDAWDIIEAPGALRAMVADGLGHGPFAAEAAREAIATFRRHPREGLAQTLELTHAALLKTRGAAVAAVELRSGTRTVHSAGVGNISMRLVHSGGAKNLVSDNGTLGASMRRAQEFKQPWTPETLLVMHSDGLHPNWDLNRYPGLLLRHPALIAGVLYRDFKRGRDDATVIVIRHQP